MPKVSKLSPIVHRDLERHMNITIIFKIPKRHPMVKWWKLNHNTLMQSVNLFTYKKMDSIMYEQWSKISRIINLIRRLISVEPSIIILQIRTCNILNAVIQSEIHELLVKPNGQVQYLYNHQSSLPVKWHHHKYQWKVL